MSVCSHTTLVMPCHPDAKTVDSNIHLHLTGGLLSEVTAVGTREQLLAFLDAAATAVRRLPVPELTHDTRSEP